VSAPPQAKKTAGQIEKETDERRTSNIAYSPPLEDLLFNPGPTIEAAS
jgi:hypothetical protein